MPRLIRMATGKAIATALPPLSRQLLAPALYRRPHHRSERGAVLGLVAARTLERVHRGATRGTTALAARCAPGVDDRMDGATGETQRPIDARAARPDAATKPAGAIRGDAADRRLDGTS